MASQFTYITLDEMKTVLNKWNIDKSGKEFVFIFPLSTKPHIEVRVCSSITVNGSRNCGKDAIRVFAVNTKTNKGWIKTKRVYRIIGWEKNLKKTVMDIFEQAKNRKEFF